MHCSFVFPKPHLIPGDLEEPDLNSDASVDNLILENEDEDPLDIEENRVAS